MASGIYLLMGLSKFHSPKTAYANSILTEPVQMDRWREDGTEEYEMMGNRRERKRKIIQNKAREREKKKKDGTTQGKFIHFKRIRCNFCSCWNSRFSCIQVYSNYKHVPFNSIFLFRQQLLIVVKQRKTKENRMQNLLHSQAPHSKAETGFNLLFSAILLSLWKKKKELGSLWLIGLD